MGKNLLRGLVTKSLLRGREQLGEIVLEANDDVESQIARFLQKRSAAMLAAGPFYRDLRLCWRARTSSWALKTMRGSSNIRSS
jgi:hypothetical protein